jgi:hypothetical protein
MKTDKGAILMMGWVLAALSLSSVKNAIGFSEKERPYSLQDSIQQKKSLFRKEYKEKLDLLESSILETRKEIAKKKSSQQAQWNKELDALDESRKNMLGKVEASENEVGANWDLLADEVREEYDETESKVRNFFKR